MFKTSSYCGSESCVEAQLEPMLVRVRQSQAPLEVLEIPGDRWQQLAVAAKSSGLLDPQEWFGSFGSRFTSDEAEAFRLGVINGEFDLAQIAPA
jgi:hypothetical protein